MNSVVFRVGAVCAVLVPLLSAGCRPGVPEELQPDEILRAELGLDDGDVVHTVSITGGEAERVGPTETVVAPGDWVQFITTDFYVHEMQFELDSLAAGARDFLIRTDQVASPPLIDAGARFVLSFAEAPEGRYPFRVEGNGLPGGGVVVVRANP